MECPEGCTPDLWRIWTNLLWYARHPALAGRTGPMDVQR